MTGLNPITLEAALPIMARAVGLTVSEDREEIVHYINKYREELFTMYDRFKLFNNTFHCICPSTFYQECVDCCDSAYQGITLPSDVVSVEHIWAYGQPLTIHTRWREGHFGIMNRRCSPVRETVEMAETFPTERDLKCVTALRIFTEREEDEGKCVKITVLDSDKNERTLSFKLIHDGWAVSKVDVKKILSVSLPSDRKGSIILAQKDGYELSRYSPYEVAPAYKRYKVNACGTVLVQGIKKYVPIYFDHEIVEVGNGLIIEAAGKYFKYGDDTSDGNELQTAQMWYNKMLGLLNGLIARHRGNAVNDVNPMLKRDLTRKTLPGYGR